MKILIITILLLLFGVTAHAAKPDVSLWLARSCVGEAGWDSYESRECAAILHVYLKRSRRYNTSLHHMVMRYSAAVKNHTKHTRPWIFGLNRRPTRPKKWPRGLDWARYRDRWVAVLKLVDDFQAGRVADPCPEAMRYGGLMDTPLVNKIYWKKIDTPGYQNIFYKMRRKTK